MVMAANIRNSDSSAAAAAGCALQPGCPRIPRTVTGAVSEAGRRTIVDDTSWCSAVSGCICSLPATTGTYPVQNRMSAETPSSAA